jgi:hypothetical protein
MGKGGAKAAAPVGKTIRDVVRYVLADRQLHPAAWREMLNWPPDVFAVAGILLEETGAYIWAADSAVRSALMARRSRRGGVRALALAWLRASVSSKPDVAVACPDIATAWSNVWEKLDKPVVGLRTNQGSSGLVEDLLFLFTTADETARDLRCLRSYADLGARQDVLRFGLRALAYLSAGDNLSRLDNERVQVFTKLSTPKPGITIRSISRYMALDFSEIDSKWINAPAFVGWREKPHRRANPRSLDMLLLPWPLTVDDDAFAECTTRRERFRFAPSESRHIVDGKPWSFSELLEASLRAAFRQVQTLDVVVFPETSLNEAELDCARGLCSAFNIPLIVAGVRTPATNSGAPGRNEARMCVRVPGGWLEYRQAKQHRWFFDRAQIKRYRLGGRLPGSPGYWEDCTIPPRELRFVRVRPGLTFCPLVCEDLAREEPAGALVRSVGPTLLLALLLDGPQLKSRWPARFATVLTDDPGCSVLTLTSFGFARRSQVGDAPPSRSVALWNDPRTDGVEEIELAEGAVGIVLTAAVDREHGMTLDGRSDEGFTTFLSLVHRSDVVLAPGRRARKRTRSLATERRTLPDSEAWALDIAAPLFESVIRTLDDAVPPRQRARIVQDYLRDIEAATKRSAGVLRAHERSRLAALRTVLTSLRKRLSARQLSAPTKVRDTSQPQSIRDFLLMWSHSATDGGGLREA